MRLFLGQLPPEAALAAADHPEAHIKSDYVCEANVYGGAFELQQGRKEEAMRLFRVAVAECPKSWSSTLPRSAAGRPMFLISFKALDQRRFPVLAAARHLVHASRTAAHRRRRRSAPGRR
jgi:hypothetical protein